MRRIMNTYKESSVIESALSSLSEKDVEEMLKQADPEITKQSEEEQEPPVNSDLKGFVTNIEEDTIDNKNFRKVLYTGKNTQLVLMSLKPKEDIGDEVHDVDQFFRVDSGSGKVVINGTEHKISDGFAIVIPAGAKHNVINDGTKDLKLYSLYSPPHHADGTIHKTKEEALKAKEHFTGKTTESDEEKFDTKYETMSH